MRTVSAVPAALANIVGIGLGYVYVGRLQYALAFIGVVICAVAMVGWSRLVFVPDAITIIVVACMLIGLVPIVHCALIALRAAEQPRRAYNRWWVYVLWIIASWILGEILVSARPVLFGFEPFRLPAASMAPTLERGDFVMVDSWYYDREEPRFGDLVVFTVPERDGVLYVKRIVGMPGDHVELRDDALIRNGDSVEEPYVSLTSRRSDAMRNFGPVDIPDNHYWLLGDNRHNSRDSRVFGAVGGDLLHGRVVHRWFSYDDGIRWDRFPEYVEQD